jgi:hypothetical protein
MQSCTTDKGESIAVRFFASFSDGKLGLPRIGKYAPLPAAALVCVEHCTQKHGSELLGCAAQQDIALLAREK